MEGMERVCWLYFQETRAMMKKEVRRASPLVRGEKIDERGTIMIYLLQKGELELKEAHTGHTWRRDDG